MIKQSKVQRLFRALRAIANKPALLNLVLSDNDLWKKYVERKWGINRLQAVSPVGLFERGTGIRYYTFDEGGSLDIDIALLKQLAAGIPHCSFFEIGTWMGQATANVADVASECYTLNLADDQMATAGLSDDYIRRIGKFSSLYPNVIHLRGDSLSYDFSSLNKKFDLVFIDGDHHYASVVSDTQNVFKYLTDQNSIVVWHDAATHPGTYRYEVIAGILDALPTAEHPFLYMVEQTKCAIYCKKLPGGFSKGRKEFNFEITFRSFTENDRKYVCR